ncbi:hypothetical protein [Amycolatopsis sp. GM8]|uniref:hypothetical protein n=1 Tax=Amycolatopsis sp. GM8 TaxID=2896530 RepID=UPI001F2A4AA8|nr:hypothetical protein [Amycolatopsis sp. GM8]
MSVLSVPVVADFVARVRLALANHARKVRCEYAGLPAGTSTVLVPTRHGDIACTIYSPPAALADAPM